MLVEIASEKGQGHLLAMAERPTLSTDLTDVIVARGDRDVVRRTAGNAGANFSPDGYSTLIKRAGQDGVLTIRLGQREDLSPDAIEGSALRLDRCRSPPPAHGGHARAAGRHQAGDERDHRAPLERAERRDFLAAQRTVLKLHRDGALGEGALLNFAKAFKYEESVAALSAMSGVKIETLDRLISGDRYDPILVAGKTIGLEWATVRALIMLRLGPNRTAAPADIEIARGNYARLMPSTAERVASFWKTRPSVSTAAIANCSPTLKRRAIIRAEDAAQRRI